MQEKFNTLSEGIEWALSTWWGVLSYVLLCLLSAAGWGWDGIDRFTFISGALILVFLIGGGRRNAKATHTKLDAITPGHILDRIEDRAEDEIEKARSECS